MRMLSLKKQMERLRKQKLRKITKFKILLGMFEEAAVANSWKGGGDPDDVPEIEEDYKRIKERIINFVKKEV